MKLLLLLIVSLSPLAVPAQKGFEWEEKPDSEKLVLKYNGRVITAYCYFDSVEKPILFPIRTLDGRTVTRGYPISPRPGERTDHPHHTGLWLNYESVNGLDFWNNSAAIPRARKHRYGSIQHVKVINSKASPQHAELVTLSHWVDSARNVLIRERTQFTFTARDSALIIDRKSRLTAVAARVVFRDVKDGLLGIRVARELEMPSSQEDRFIDAQGNVTTVAQKDNSGVTGLYMNREGATGDEVWGKRSEWVMLSGVLNDKPASIGIIDHPANPGYPAYWHARGYGLFAVNPLGQEVFSHGKERMNLELAQGETVDFLYRIIIHSGRLTRAKMDNLMREFTKR